MTSGIYCIENLINGKKYIGQSIDIEKRKRIHISQLRGEYHPNKYLQNSWNKYGEENFKFWIIYESSDNMEILQLMELYFIEYYNSFVEDNLGYNMTKGGDGTLGVIGEKHWNYGKHLSLQTKEQISHTLKGNIPWNKGKKGIYTEDMRNKMGKGQRGKHMSVEVRKKMLKSNKGKHSEPTKRLWENEDYRKRMSESHKKPWSKARREAYERGKK